MSACREMLERVGRHGDRDALIWRDCTETFAQLAARTAELGDRFARAGIGAGAVIALEADFSPIGVAALLATIATRGIAVPLTPATEKRKPELHRIAEVEWIVRVDAAENLTITATQRTARHELFQTLRTRAHAGLVLFSSGSTGASKAVVHDLDLLLRKYLQPRHCHRTLAFLLFDHIGGIDTLCYNLANGSCLVTLPDHAPDTVGAAIARHRVEVMPVSPTFLNLLLVSGALERHDFSSLRIIAYGAEVMPEATLRRAQTAFPGVRFVQKFGASEVGTLRSHSRESGSVWVKVGGEGYATRVVDGLLEIKADSAMLGYLNAPSAFTADGWFRTGDAVQVDGEWMRILGRRTEVINVGGEKVYPAEVESVLEAMDNVAEATVQGEAHALTGQIVTARCRLLQPEAPAAFRQRVRAFCTGRLEPFKIPARIVVVEEGAAGQRHKKMRGATTA